MKKTAKKPKKSDDIVEFNTKYGYDISKIKKCWIYYYKKDKKTKRNGALALHYTYKYIDYCYKDKNFISQKTNEDKLKTKNELLIRFGELSKMHKYSYSIISSVAGSFLVSFLFLVLQISDNNTPSFFEQIFGSINSMFEVLSSSEIIVSLILLPFIILVICIMLVVPFSILIITYLILDVLYYSNYRNMVVPYERKVILKALRTFDERYKELD